MNKSKASIILYDDQCPLCTFQMRLLTWLDWFNCTTLLPISDPRARIIAPRLTREDLSAAIHCITKSGEIYRGARCLRHAGLRMPLLAPMTLVLWLPGVIWIAERIYQRVSRNRYLLSRLFGCRKACSLLPARDRANEKPLPKPAEKA